MCVVGDEGDKGKKDWEEEGDGGRERRWWRRAFWFDGIVRG